MASSRRRTSARLTGGRRSERGARDQRRIARRGFILPGQKGVTLRDEGGRDAFAARRRRAQTVGDPSWEEPSVAYVAQQMGFSEEAARAALIARERDEPESGAEDAEGGTE